MAAFLEKLTAIHDANFFNGIAERLGHPLRTEERGSELNVGNNLRTVHPVIRTNRMFAILSFSLFWEKFRLRRLVFRTGEEGEGGSRMTRMNANENSCDALEINLREQSLHKTYRRAHKRRIG